MKTAWKGSFVEANKNKMHMVIPPSYRDRSNYAFVVGCVRYYFFENSLRVAFVGKKINLLAMTNEHMHEE